MKRNTADILTDYQPGDEHGWATEFAYLATRHDSRLRMLRKSIEKRGIRRPLLLGNDGRLWDGHHRLLIAVGLGIEFVPVERTNSEHHQ